MNGWILRGFSGFLSVFSGVFKIGVRVFWMIIVFNWFVSDYLLGENMGKGKGGYPSKKPGRPSGPGRDNDPPKKKK